MIKILVLLFGLAVGFGAGVYWGVHNPDQAKDLAAEEERRFLEQQKKISEAIKAKLDSLIKRQVTSAEATGSGKSGPAGSGFVSGAPKSGQKAAPAGPDPELVKLRDQEEQQLAELEERLEELGAE